jgi:drug/metabolite transporter (DMT)-like permease
MSQDEIIHRRISNSLPSPFAPTLIYHDALWSSATGKPASACAVADLVSLPLSRSVGAAAQTPGFKPATSDTSEVPSTDADPWDVQAECPPTQPTGDVVSLAPPTSATSSVVSIGLTLTVMLGYGLSFFINSILGRFLGSPHWSESLLLNSSGRCITLAAVIPVLYYMHKGPPLQLVYTREALLPVAVAFFGNIGFIAYFEVLQGGSEVSRITPMIGLYTSIPVIVALIWRGEDRTWQKLVGICLSFVAVLLLGFSGQSSDSPEDSVSIVSSSAVAYKGMCFLIAFVLWGVNDVISSRVNLDPVRVAAACMVGYMSSAIFMGLVCLAVLKDEAVTTMTQLQIQAQDGTGNTTALTAFIESHSSPGFGWPHIAVMCGNAIAVIGWLAFVRLGQIGQASSFIPVISLYVLIPVFLSIVFLGEEVNALKVLGIVTAAASVLLMSRSWKPKKAVATPMPNSTADDKTHAV